MSASAAESIRALRAMLPAAEGPLRALEPVRALSAEIALQGRLDESLRAAPAHAGPLNAEGVVVRTMQRLQTVAPGYARRVVVQMDAWAALEALGRPDQSKRTVL